MEEGLLTQWPQQPGGGGADFVPTSTSLLDNLPGSGNCLLQAFEFCPSTVQYGTGRVAREMGQNKRAGDTSLESGVEIEDGFMGFCRSP